MEKEEEECNILILNSSPQLFHFLSYSWLLEVAYIS